MRRGLSARAMGARGLGWAVVVAMVFVCASARAQSDRASAWRAEVSRPSAPASSPPRDSGTPEASAQGDRWELPLEAELHFGLAAPTGLMGALVGYSPHRQLTFYTGAGLGATGPQTALHSVLRMPLGRVALGFGVGASHGEYQEFRPFDNARQEERLVTWLNADAQLIVRGEGGTTWRLYLGQATDLTADGRPERLWYIGTSVGQAFGAGS